MFINIARTGMYALLTALLVSVSPLLVAQTVIEEDFMENLSENARYMLKEKEPAFETVSTPAKWDKQSAVVIGYSRNIGFDRKSRLGFGTLNRRELFFLEKVRFKIKLNDNNSVSNFSEIYFRCSEKDDGFIARIIKEGDTAVEVDLKNAVAIERGSEIPSFFQSFFDKVSSKTHQYYKLAVPDLEPGDILEYVSTTKSKMDVSGRSYIEFPPSFEICSKDYPVMHNEIIIEVDEKSFFKSLSLNGAPAFKRESTPEKDLFRYIFTDKDRDTEKDVNFVSPYIQYPIVKFQVIYSSKDDVKGALVGEKGDMKSHFTKEELVRKAREDYEKLSELYINSYTSQKMWVNTAYSNFVKYGAKQWTDEEYINNAYYYVRHFFLNRWIPQSDKVFALLFEQLLEKKKIESELIITTPNNIGKIQDVLFEEEITFVMRVKNKFYYMPTDYSNPLEMDENLLSNKGWVVQESVRKRDERPVEEVTLPATVAADNTEAQALNVELASDMATLRIDRMSTYKGLRKVRASERALALTPFALNDYLNFGEPDRKQDYPPKLLEKKIKEEKEIIDDFNKNKPEYAQKTLEAEFERKVSNVRFNLITDGRSLKKNALSYREEFELPDFVRKAGKKYLVNINGLIGSQLQIRKEQRTRKHEIDVRYPKSFMWSIRFKVPAGYKAEGLAELHQNIDNETGLFKMEAKEEGGVVIVNVMKVYRKRNVEAAKWSDMLAFLDAAYNATFRYILLTPVQK